MLTADQLTTLERRLDLRAARLSEEIATVRGRDSDAALADVEDSKDAAAREAQEFVADAEVARDLEELREIRLARQRISDCCYGTCLDCGVDIDLARLLAQPQASRCVSCEEESEQASGMVAAGGRRPRRA